MSVGYSIKKGNLVVIWLDSEDTPGNLEQPHWPNGTEWASKKEAEDWAKAWVAYNADETADRPGDGPDQPLIPHPTNKEVNDALAANAVLAQAQHAEAEVGEGGVIVGTELEQEPKAVDQSPEAPVEAE